MAEEEDDSNMSLKSEVQPQAVRRDSRKVPGGFGHDDIDDLSPNKEDFDESVFKNSEAHQQNNRIPSLDASKLPALPPPGDSSQFYNSTNGHIDSEAHMKTVDEEELERHLNDVESSFMPVVDTIPLDEDRKGLDDTYLFDGVPPPVKTLENNDIHSVSKGDSESSTSSNGYHTAAATRANNSEEEETVDIGALANTTSDLETMSSSPTAAAAARTVSRAISSASNPAFDYPADADTLRGQPEHEEEQETPRKIPSAFADSSDSRSTLRHHDSSQNLKEAAGSTPGHALVVRKGKRPNFLRGRHSSHHSQHSSISSVEGSDVTVGPDYPLQSRETGQMENFSRQSSTALSRSISLGSMASGIEGDYDDDYMGSNLATLTEEGQNRERRDAQESPSPETPRAVSRTLALPSDTVIAKHVKDVKVPESMMKDYRKRLGKGSPNGRSGSAGPETKNLTLREQNNSIDKLSKENYALKLKCMFLTDQLAKLSDGGEKAIFAENIELKTALGMIQKEKKALLRKIKDLEKRLNDDEDRPSTAHSVESGEATSPKWFDREGAQEQEEELIYLRERVEEYSIEVEKLRNEAISRESEKRNLAEVVRQMGERRSGSVEVADETDLWKDLLEQETSRREQSDEENKRLRDEILRLKMGTPAATPGLTHTTNIFNITKKRQVSPSRPRSGHSNSDRLSDRNGAISQQSTLVEEVRRECEQLRHENAELRREVGAQTNMLTSRNREKERLYQEIEDLKLNHRRGGGSVSGDSILDRSASRAHERSNSRASGGTKQSNYPDAEREELENKCAEFRNQVNRLKIEKQDLASELRQCQEDFDIAIEQKQHFEQTVADLQISAEEREEDLITVIHDRDQALQAEEDMNNKFEFLRQDAQEQLDGYENDVKHLEEDIVQLQNDLANERENFAALQNEFRQMSESFVRIEDLNDEKDKRIQDLESQIQEATQELEQMDKNVAAANEKVGRLSVQQESSQSEIAFLREEQDGDKIKIGDLEAAIRNADQSIQDERDRVKELEQRLAKERQQREAVAGKEKQETQQYINELNRDASAAKDEARRLRKNLSSREVEVAEWKQRLVELENNLREALGDLNGTRSSLLNSVAKLQRELENTGRELDITRQALAEKDRAMKQKDDTLETHGLEVRKLADFLDKERQLHRNTKHQYETFQKNAQHTSRTLSQHEARVVELEQSRQQDRRKISSLENSLKEQTTERNQLLLNLWSRLSALCGSDWAHSNRLINGKALPSMETVTTMLPGFSKNLYGALKTIETIIGDFRLKIATLDKVLTKEYHTLEANLEQRTKRLEKVEALVKTTSTDRAAPLPTPNDHKAEVKRLREVNRTLKAETDNLRLAVQEARSTVYMDGSPSPSVPTGPRQQGQKQSRTSTLTRHQSSSVVESQLHAQSRPRDLTRTSTSTSEDRHEQGSSSASLAASDARWEIRLKEQEQKLKAEREARLIDRNAARNRLNEKERELAAKEKELEMQRRQIERLHAEAAARELKEGVAEKGTK